MRRSSHSFGGRVHSSPEIGLGLPAHACLPVPLPAARYKEAARNSVLRDAGTIGTESSAALSRELSPNHRNTLHRSDSLHRQGRLESIGERGFVGPKSKVEIEQQLRERSEWLEERAKSEKLLDQIVALESASEAEQKRAAERAATVEKQHKAELDALGRELAFEKQRCEHERRRAEEAAARISDLERVLEDTQAEGKKALAAERADREALLQERDERERTAALKAALDRQCAEEALARQAVAAQVELRELEQQHADERGRAEAAIERMRVEAELIARRHHAELENMRGLAHEARAETNALKRAEHTLVEAMHAELDQLRRQASESRAATEQHPLHLALVQERAESASLQQQLADESARAKQLRHDLAAAMVQIEEQQRIASRTDESHSNETSALRNEATELRAQLEMERRALEDAKRQTSLVGAQLDALEQQFAAERRSCSQELDRMRLHADDYIQLSDQELCKLRAQLEEHSAMADTELATERVPRAMHACERAGSGRSNSEPHALLQQRALRLECQLEALKRQLQLEREQARRRTAQ